MRVRARVLSGDLLSGLRGEAKAIPTFRPRYVIGLDYRPVAAGEVQAEGYIGFDIPADAVGERKSLELVFHPSVPRLMDGRVIPWSLEVISASAVERGVQEYSVDIGHDGDLPYVGPGFSYPEGAQTHPSAWVSDRDFRWSRPGCKLRVPVVPGNMHTITLRGHVPVGFRVVSRGVELARFDRPNPSYAYPFDVRPEVTGTQRWLPMTLINIDPMPLPNLDLRELFWALDEVVVVSRGQSRRMDFRRLPAPSLLRAAFRAALQRCEIEPVRIPIALKARWDLPAGYKSASQITQEALTITTFGGTWTWFSDIDPGDAEYVSRQVIAPALADIARVGATSSDTHIVADIAIFVSQRQRAAARLQPGTRNEVLEPARGAFQAFLRLQRPTILIDERDLFRRADAFRCIILPGLAFYPPSIWPMLERYVAAGGSLIIAPGLNIPLGKEESAERVSALAGIALNGYHRYEYRILFEDQRIPIYSNDWQAIFSPRGAKVLLWMIPKGAKYGADFKPPAVALNEFGQGRVLTVPFDIFGQINRYNNTQYIRLVGWLLDQVLDDRLLTIECAPSLAVGVSANPRHMVVQLVNVTRGQFDSGGLMNASRTFVFAEDIPPAPPARLTLRCPQKVLRVRTVPPDPAAKWSYANGRLTVDLSSIKLSRAVVAEFDEPLGLAPRRLALERPAGNALVTIDEAHRDAVSLVDALETPWPVERVQDAAHLWIGEGAAEGLRFKMACFRPGKFRLAMLVTPGHGRTDKLRHLELALNGRIVWRADIDDRREVAATLDLSNGVHEIAFYCTDQATITEHPNGDRRSLLVALRSVQITPDN